MPTAYESCSGTATDALSHQDNGRSASERPPDGCEPGTLMASASLPNTSTKVARPAAARGRRQMSYTFKAARAGTARSARPLGRPRLRRPVIRRPR